MRIKNVRFIAHSATLLFALMSSTAFAADFENDSGVGVREDRWSGFYMGAHVGIAYSDTPLRYEGAPLNTCAAITGSVADCNTQGNVNSNGLAGGVQAGFNHQTGYIVWGVEGEVAWRGNNGKTTFLPSFGVTQTFEESNRWLVTLRPRIGFAYDRAIIYATGGVAWGSVGHTATFFDPLRLVGGIPLTFSQSDTRIGWTTGTGIEYALTPHWSFKGEYLYVDLGTTSISNPGVTGSWWPTNAKFIEQEHLLRAGLNYRF
jgi:outer membrane immunogenic protein